jgi:hypothetical protein
MIDHGTHPRARPPGFKFRVGFQVSSPPRDDRDAGDSDSVPCTLLRSTADSVLLRLKEATLRELLAAAQATRKAKPDAGRVDTVTVQVWTRCCGGPRSQCSGDDAAPGIGKLRPWWPGDGPYTVTATVACPRAARAGPIMRTTIRWHSLRG